MAVEVNSSTDGIGFGDLDVHGPRTPGRTFAFTIHVQEAPANYRLFTKWAAGASNWSFLIQVTGTDEIGFTLGDAATPSPLWGIRTTSAPIVNGNLLRVVCRHDGTTGVGTAAGDIWINGVEQADENWFGGSISSDYQDTPTTVDVGYDTGSAAQGLNGYYSEAAIWKQIVPDWVAVAYGKGMSPDFWPYDLFFYAPLWNLNHLVDHRGGAIGSESGTPGSIAHPSVYYPGRTQLGVPGRFVPVFPQQIEPLYPKPEVLAY